MKKSLGMLAVMLLAMTGAMFAEDPVQIQPGVARVSLIHGDVSMQRGDSGDWVAVTLNTPIVSGDRISAASGSRAEVQLDFANVLRLDENASAKITDLNRTRIQVQVAQGMVNYSVLKGSEADAEIDTPNVAVHPLKNGSYRIQVNSDSETQVIVRKGKAQVTTQQGSTDVESGQIITIQGSDDPQYQTASAPRKDGFDSWNNDRDHVIQTAQSWNHTDRYYTGSQDLDAYGHWERAPEYGSVWVPAQAAMGFLRALGLGSISLRSLVCSQRFVVLVAWSSVCVPSLLSSLGTRIRVILRVQSWRRVGGLWFRPHWLVADRTSGRFLSVVWTPSQPGERN